MKLRLPKQLCAALMAAALTSVSQQAFADTTVATGETLVVDSGTTSSQFGTITVQNGAAIQLKDGATVDARFTYDSNALISVQVAEEASATWNAAAQPNANGTGVSSIDVARNATFTVNSSSTENPLFVRGNVDSVITLHAGSSLISNTSISGWGMSAYTTHRTLNLEAGSSWQVKGQEWLNNTVINLEGGNIDLSANMNFERNLSSFHVLSSATAMSTITGTSWLQLGGGNTSKSSTVNGHNGDLFDVARGNFELNDTNKADLEISAKIGNAGNAHVSTFLKAGDGVLRLTNSSNDYNRGTYIDAGTLVAVGATLGSGAVEINNAAVLQLEANSDFTTSNVISGDGKVVKTGSSAAKLAGNNTYTGGTEITGGTLIISQDTALGTGDVTVNSGAKLQLGKSVSNQRDGEAADHTTTISNNIILNNAELYNASNYECAVINLGTLSVSGDSTLTQNSWNTFWNINHINQVDADAPGTLKWNMTSAHWTNSVMSLTGAGDFSGIFTANRTDSQGDNGAYQAYLEIAHENALQHAVLNATGNGGSYMTVALKSDTVNLAGLRGNDKSILMAGGVSKTPGSSSARQGSVAPESTGTSHLVITSKENANDTFSGKVLSGVSITKNGSGSQILSGNLADFDGNLTVNEGTLTITGTTLPQTGSVAEGTRGTLTINGGTLNIGDGDARETSLSSFSAVNLAGGVLSYNNKKDTLHNVTVTGTDSRIFSKDMGSRNDNCTLTFAGTTQLDGTLTLQNYWNAQFAIENVAGAGTLKVTGADINGNVATTTSEDGIVTINSLSGFTGNLTFDSTGARATVNTGAASVTMGDLTVQHRSEVTINGYTDGETSGVLTGNTLYLDGNNTTLTFDGGTSRFTNMGRKSGGDTNANVTVNLNNGAVLEITNAPVFVAHGERVNIDGTSQLNLKAGGLTLESVDGSQTASLYVPLGSHNGGYYTYSIDHSGIFCIENAKASYSKGGTAGNQLINTEVHNIGTASLTVNNASNTLVGVNAEGGAILVQNAASSASTLKSIRANGGDVTIQSLGADATVNLNELYIASGKTVSAYTGTPTAEQIAAAQNGSNTTVEATLAISNGTLTAGNGAHLNAHLSLGDNTTLDIADATVGGAGLTMGSTVTFEQGAKMKLSDAIIGGLNELIANQAFNTGLTLFSGVDAFYINDDAYVEGATYAASDYFKLTGVTRPWDFVVKFSDDALSQGGSGKSIYLWMETPEPATATLSLLALAALAARRKRK